MKRTNVVSISPQTSKFPMNQSVYAFKIWLYFIEFTAESIYSCFKLNILGIKPHNQVFLLILTYSILKIFYLTDQEKRWGEKYSGKFNK